MTFSLNVPAESGQVRTIRMFAASVARKFGSDEGTVEDLKLAISEACNIALERLDSQRGDRIAVAIVAGETMLEFQLDGLSAASGGAERQSSGPEDTLDVAAMARSLITALFPEARVLDDGPTIALPVRLGSGLT